MTNTQDDRYTGRVKWFNSRNGFGYVTILEGDRAGEDVFVHHSNIYVSKEQYRYLVQGEYVTFQIVPVEDEKHDCQSADVRGIHGAQLMCETRREARENRPRPGGEQNDNTTRRQRRRPRNKEHSTKSTTEEWVVMRRRPNTSERGNANGNREPSRRGRGRGRGPRVNTETH